MWDVADWSNSQNDQAILLSGFITANVLVLENKVFQNWRKQEAYEGDKREKHTFRQAPSQMKFAYLLKQREKTTENILKPKHFLKRQQSQPSLSKWALKGSLKGSSGFQNNHVFVLSVHKALAQKAVLCAQWVLPKLSPFRGLLENSTWWSFIHPSSLAAGKFNWLTGNLGCTFKKMTEWLVDQKSALNAGCNLQLSSQSCYTQHRKNLRLIRADSDSTNSIMTLNNLMLRALTWGEGMPSFILPHLNIKYSFCWISMHQIPQNN